MPPEHPFSESATNQDEAVQGAGSAAKTRFNTTIFRQACLAAWDRLLGLHFRPAVTTGSLFRTVVRAVSFCYNFWFHIRALHLKRIIVESALT
jgi:hypothetical protein